VFRPRPRNVPHSTKGILMTYFRIVPTLLLAAGLGAGEATLPLMEARLADGTQLTKHWEASILALVWKDPAMAPLRDKLSEGLDKAEKELGFAPLAVLAAIKDARMVLTGLSKGDQFPIPHLQATVDLGPLATTVLDKMAAAAGKDFERVEVAGAEVAYVPAKATFPVTIARFGTRLALALGEPIGTVPAVAASVSDFHLNADMTAGMKALDEALTPEMAALITSQLDTLKPYLGRITWDSTLLPEGMLDRMNSSAAVPPYLLPIDRAVLARLPAQALMAGGFGFDAPAYWVMLKEQFRAQAAAMAKGGAEVDMVAMMEQQAESAFQEAGLACTLDEVLADLKGTVLMAIAPGAPFPTITIAIPRGPAVDQVVERMLQEVDTAMPAMGEAAIVPIPNVPLPIVIMRDQGHWLLTSDTAFSDQWATGASNGWSDSTAGALAISKAPAQANMIGASDTPAVLRTISSFASLALAMVPSLEPKQKTAIAQALSRLAAKASTGYMVSGATAGGQMSEFRGLLGLGFMPAVIAAIAIPNLLESRTTANESAAAATLKSGIFPAEIQFQAGGYTDVDQDNIGEYGFLPELAGGRNVGPDASIKLSLLSPQFAEPDAEVNGYRFTIFLADGMDGAVGDQAEPLPAEGTDQRERSFIAYAWPVDDSTGHRMFALDVHGMIYAAPWNGQDPEWNSLYAGGTWDDQPGGLWLPYRK